MLQYGWFSSQLWDHKSWQRGVIPWLTHTVKLLRLCRHLDHETAYPFKWCITHANQCRHLLSYSCLKHSERCPEITGIWRYSCMKHSKGCPEIIANCVRCTDSETFWHLSCKHMHRQLSCWKLLSRRTSQQSFIIWMEKSDWIWFDFWSNIRGKGSILMLILALLESPLETRTRAI